MNTYPLADVLRYSGFTTAYDNILNPASEPWRGHIAFARVLMAEARPELVVELGSYYGVSFFAMCQAVKEEGLPTRCMAVDSWEGDPQAGFYGNEVYEAVKARAEAHYPGIATLIRSLFDDALPQFADNSIDVLHIDGLHTYEAVRHDFETWLPKVRPGGIILFHDVNEFRDDFGAHKVWDEIVPLTTESYLFRHSHGLGVWRKPGGEPLTTPFLAALLGADREAALLADTYITGLADKEIFRIVSDQRLKELAARDAEMEALRQLLGQTRDEVLRTQDEVLRTRSEVDRVTHEYLAVRTGLQQELAVAAEANGKTLAELDRLLNSRSWKLTAPLRVSGRMVRDLVRPGSRCGVVARLVRGLCALPASLLAYPSWAEWKKAFRGGSSFFKHIESNAHTVLEQARDRNALVRLGVTLPLKFGLKVREFGGVLPALSKGLAKAGKLVARGDLKQLLPTSTPTFSAHLENDWRAKPGPVEYGITRQCGPLQPGLALAAAPHRTATASPDADVVDILIPVYNGQRHLENLLPALFANTSAPHRFVFIDDHSPDATLWPWLQAQLEGRDDCLLLRNEENLGFPATVNRGAALSQRNFVILNTDTVVPSGWLERLMAPLLADPTIASATPFSNAATIFSFPTPNDDAGNAAFLESVGLEALNDALCGLDPRDIPLEAPTGVGFCMAVSRRAWDGHFGFDAQRFGKGYGEEVDWCQRSLRSGWKHVLVPNLYVAHVHGGSFAPETKAAQLRHAEDTVNALYPGYTPSVVRHIDNNPWAPLRTAALLRLCAQPARRAALYLGHCRGGGAAMYLDRRVAAETADGNADLVMIYDARLKDYTLTMAVGSHRFGFSGVSPKTLLEADLSFLTAVRVNNLVDWPLEEDHRHLLDWVAELARKNGAELDMLFHDFYVICPRINHLTPDFRFCDLPTDMLACTNCASTGQPLQVSMLGWRQKWQDFLSRCTTLTFFSHNTMELVSRAYTLPADRCRIIPHAPLRTFNTTYAVPAEGPMCIAVLGHVGINKGSAIVEELAVLLQQQHPDARILVIGVYDNKLYPNILVTGPYDGDHLPDILAYHKATVALFPSICPETFSYVVQELCQLEMPLVCFDIGAPPERVRDYAHGLVAEALSAPAALKALEALDARRRTPQSAS